MSDVQGNVDALRAVLDDIVSREGVEATFSTGDIVGLGPHPNEVLDLLREAGVESVKGNYDDAVAFQRLSSGVDFPDEAAEQVDRAAVSWTRRTLTPENIEYVRNLPFDLRILETGGSVKVKANAEDERITDFRRNMLSRALVGSLGQKQIKIKPRRVLIVHGSPRALNEFVRPDTANSILDAISMSSQADVILSGHPGVSFIREHKSVTFVGVGSVSGPRTPPGEAEYVMIDLAEEIQADFVRVEYDPGPHLAAIMDLGLPPALAARFDLTSL
jgi:predicted phosphodiesterase